MREFQQYISRFLLLTYFLAGMGHVMPLIEYGLDRDRIIEEECELREQQVNDCQGFCVITNRYKKIHILNTSVSHQYKK